MAPNILVGIVDFDCTARDTYGALLHIELGANVVSARSGIELIEQLGRTVPDLLLVGAERPPVDGGLGAIEALNSRLPWVPLIAIGRHYPTLGANQVIDEPVDAAELVALVRSLLPQVPPGDHTDVKSDSRSAQKKGKA